MNVLVTNANSRMALCMARSLSRRGNRVITADYIPCSMTFFSKHVTEKFLYPSPYSFPDEFLSTLKEKINQYRVDVIIPIHEETFLISKYSTHLSEVTNFAVPQYSAILNVHNKCSLCDLLNALGISTPKTVALDQLRSDGEIRDRFPNKVALKPRQGGGNWGIHLLDQKNDYLKQIDCYFKHNRVEKHRVLLQEWNPTAAKYSHVVFYQDGKLVAEFADKHLRDLPLGGGAGCLRISCDPGPMRDYSKRLFGYLNWHGIAEVEYVKHAETGELYLIEVNPRVWGGINSAITSGLDVADVILNIALGKQVSPVSYRNGTITRWFWGDMRVFPDYLFEERLETWRNS